MANGDDATAVVDAPATQDATTDAVADSGAPEQTSAETTPEQRISDLETRLAASEKTANDYKSQVIGRQSAADRDEALHSRLDAMSAQNLRIADLITLRETDPDEADKQIRALKAESADIAASQKSQIAWASTKSEYLNDLSELLEGTGLDPRGAELATTAAAWQAADAAQDKVGMERALRLAERAIAKAKTAAPIEPETRDAKERMEMATGPSGGASAESDEAIWRAYGKGEIKFTDKVAKAKAALGY